MCYVCVSSMPALPWLSLDSPSLDSPYIAATVCCLDSTSTRLIYHVSLSCLRCPGFPRLRPPYRFVANEKTASVYASYVTSQSLTLCELLEAFPSCKPRPGTLLALLPPLPPRYYSVASSQLATVDTVAVAFSVVSFRLPHARADSHGGGDVGFVTRRGLCTNWLEGMLAPLLQGGGGTGSEGGGEGLSVPVFLKPTKEFLLPASAKWPCVLIGPGTG